MNTDQPLPRLRPLDIKRIVHEGDPYFLLRDPLELREGSMLVAEMFGPLLMQFDGVRTLAEATADVQRRFGLPLTEDALLGFAQSLSTAYLLEDEVYADALRQARDAYRSAPYRMPALADRAYPGDPDELTATLRGYEQRAGALEGVAEDIIALVSPHIDYARGWPVYAALWRQAAPAVRAAEVVVIFGTDHSGSPGALTLTRQRYATPWGVLPTDDAIIDALAAELGEDAAFAEELHHRAEHSIELAATWLHHIRDGQPCTVIPILCGHPQPYLTAGAVGADTPAARALATLRRLTAGRRLLTVAAADLAHVGPAFGDPEPFDPADKARVRLADDELLAACHESGDAVLQAVGRIDDQFRVCGLSPIALTLAFTGPVAAEVTGYDQCPADHDGGDGSIVSIAGVLLRERDE